MCVHETAGSADAAFGNPEVSFSKAELQPEKPRRGRGSGTAAEPEEVNMNSRLPIQRGVAQPHRRVRSDRGGGRSEVVRTDASVVPRAIVHHRLSRLRGMLADESGSATAEYAVATMAAVGFAGLLVLILRGDEVRGILTDLVRKALTVAG